MKISIDETSQHGGHCSTWLTTTSPDILQNSETVNPNMCLRTPRLWPVWRYSSVGLIGGKRHIVVHRRAWSKVTDGARPRCQIASILYTACLRPDITSSLPITRHAIDPIWAALKNARRDHNTATQGWARDVEARDRYDTEQAQITPPDKGGGSWRTRGCKRALSWCTGSPERAFGSEGPYTLA